MTSYRGQQIVVKPYEAGEGADKTRYQALVGAYRFYGRTPRTATSLAMAHIDKMVSKKRK